jgi:DNA-binding NarL/FixJ family response regulator
MKTINALYVDDSEVQLHHFSSLLNTNGFSIESHLTVESAFTRLCHSGLDLAIFDFAMPEKSGLDLLIDVRHVQPHLPVAILTVHPDSPDIERFRQLQNSEHWFRVIDKAARPGFIIQECKQLIAESAWINRSREAIQEEFDRLRVLHWAAGMIATWSRYTLSPEQAVESIRKEARNQRMSMIDLANRIYSEPELFSRIWQRQ